MELTFNKEDDEPLKDEAFNGTDRGILKTDSKGTIKHGPRKRLDKACQLLKAAGRRDWQALAQGYGRCDPRRSASARRTTRRQ